MELFAKLENDKSYRLESCENTCSGIITINQTVDYMARGVDITRAIGRVGLKVKPVLGPEIAQALRHIFNSVINSYFKFVYCACYAHISNRVLFYYYYYYYACKNKKSKISCYTVPLRQ